MFRAGISPIQHLLPGGFTLDAAYVANHGVNNETGWNVNAGEHAEHRQQQPLAFPNLRPAQ